MVYTSSACSLPLFTPTHPSPCAYPPYPQANSFPSFRLFSWGKKSCCISLDGIGLWIESILYPSKAFIIAKSCITERGPFFRPSNQNGRMWLSFVVAHCVFVEFKLGYLAVRASLVHCSGTPISISSSDLAWNESRGSEGGVLCGGTSDEILLSSEVLRLLRCRSEVYWLLSISQRFGWEAG